MTETVIATAVALTVGIVHVVKQTRYVHDRIVPVLPIVAGLVWAYFLGAQGFDIATYGVMIGLMASGAWSGSKRLVSGK